MDDSGGSQQDKIRESVEYTCPMHPEIRSLSPGFCPKCGMRLVPIRKKEDDKTTFDKSPLTYAGK